MDLHEVDMRTLVKRMPDSIRRPLRDFVYQEMYDNKLKINAIQQDIDNGKISQAHAEHCSGYVAIMQYKEFLECMRDICIEPHIE